MSKVFKKFQSQVIDFTVYKTTESQFMMETVEAIVQKKIEEKGYCSYTDLLDIINDVIEQNRGTTKEEVDTWYDELEDELINNINEVVSESLYPFKEDK